MTATTAIAAETVTTPENSTESATVQTIPVLIEATPDYAVYEDVPVGELAARNRAVARARSWGNSCGKYHCRVIIYKGATKNLNRKMENAGGRVDAIAGTLGALICVQGSPVLSVLCAGAAAYVVGDAKDHLKQAAGSNACFTIKYNKALGREGFGVDKTSNCKN